MGTLNIVNSVELQSLVAVRAVYDVGGGLWAQRHVMYVLMYVGVGVGTVNRLMALNYNNTCDLLQVKSISQVIKTDAAG